MEELNNVVEVTETKETNETNEQMQKELEQLRAELEKVNNEKTKLKASFDKASSDVSNYKKQLNEKMSAEEKTQQERLEAETKMKEDLENAQKRLKLYEYENAYLEMGLTKEKAEEVTKYEIDGNRNEWLNAMKELLAEREKQGENKYINGRPDLKIGGDNKAKIDPFLQGLNS